MWQRLERAKIEAKADAIWRVIADLPNHTTLAGSGEVRAIRLTGPLEPGVSFESDIDVGEHVPPVVCRNRIDVVREPAELRWTSFPPLEPDQTPLHQLECAWWFKLTPGKGETLVEHGFRMPRPRAGADQLAAWLARTDRIKRIGQGMQRTLEQLRARVEA